jgi:hypothetical protein
LVFLCGKILIYWWILSHSYRSIETFSWESLLEAVFSRTLSIFLGSLLFIYLFFWWYWGLNLASHFLGFARQALLSLEPLHQPFIFISSDLQLDVQLIGFRFSFPGNFSAIVNVMFALSHKFWYYQLFKFYFYCDLFLWWRSFRCLF